eukprot:jgi/Chlat1/6566/Chrsp45S06039
MQKRVRQRLAASSRRWRLDQLPDSCLEAVASWLPVQERHAVLPLVCKRFHKLLAEAAAESSRDALVCFLKAQIETTAFTSSGKLCSFADECVLRGQHPVCWHGRLPKIGVHVHAKLLKWSALACDNKGHHDVDVAELPAFSKHGPVSSPYFWLCAVTLTKLDLHDDELGQALYKVATITELVLRHCPNVTDSFLQRLACLPTLKTLVQTSSCAPSTGVLDLLSADYVIHEPETPELHSLVGAIQLRQLVWAASTAESASSGEASADATSTVIPSSLPPRAAYDCSRPLVVALNALPRLESLQVFTSTFQDRFVTALLNWTAQQAVTTLIISGWTSDAFVEWPPLFYRGCVEELTKRYQGLDYDILHDEVAGILSCRRSSLL